jgi:SpoVK/Ycf46/Vps4 family AAA+-type ATPase
LVDHRGVTLEPRDLDQVAKESARFSGADIEGVVADASDEARTRKEPLGLSDLLEQIERNRIQVQARYERFNRLREWARLHAEPASDPD